MKLGREVFKALAAVAWSDGSVAAEEAALMRRAAQACGLAGDDLIEVEQSLTKRVRLDDVGALDLSHDEKAFVYSIALWLSRADGVVHAKEKSTLRELASRLGLSAREQELAGSAQLDPRFVPPGLEGLAREIEASASEDQPVDALPLPPGSRGWPVVGETLSFVSQPFDWVAERLAQHGPIFKSRILGREVVVITGPDAADLWIDDEKLKRDQSLPDHVFKLFGGFSLPTLDDEPHRIRRAQVMAAFDDEALASYLPRLSTLLHGRVARWASEGELALVPALRSLAVACIADSMLGNVAAADLTAVEADYAAVTQGFAAIPVAVVGSDLHKALAARDRLLARLHSAVAQKRREPGHEGLSRMLAARGAGGRYLDDEGAVLELHHIFLAGYIVFALLAGAVIQLAAHPHVRAAVEAEIAALGDISLASLGAMEMTNAVVREVKRITPVLPLLFARARKTFAWGGHRVPEGYQVSLALHASHVLDSVYRDPRRFDPARMLGDRCEHMRHAHAFCPQGPGPMTGHRCAGERYATLIMQLFLIHTLRAHTFMLPQQDLAYDLSCIPPVPKGGLTAQLVPKMAIA